MNLLLTKKHIKMENLMYFYQSVWALMFTALSLYAVFTTKKRNGVKRLIFGTTVLGIIFTHILLTNGNYPVTLHQTFSWIIAVFGLISSIIAIVLIFLGLKHIYHQYMFSKRVLLRSEVDVKKLLYGRFTGNMYGITINKPIYGLDSHSGIRLWKVSIGSKEYRDYKNQIYLLLNGKEYIAPVDFSSSEDNEFIDKHGYLIKAVEKDGMVVLVSEA